MNLQAYRKIAPGLNAEIASVLAKYNLKVRKHSASVDERGGAVFLRIEAYDENAKDASGNATNPDRERFKQFCSFSDLKPEWLDAIFSLGRESYKVIGLKARGTNSVLVERLSDHSVRVCPPDVVSNAFLAGEKR